MYSASPRMESRVRVSCLDHRTPALLLVVAMVGWEGGLPKQAPGQQGTTLEAWGSSVCSQRISRSQSVLSSQLIAEKPELRSTLLAGRPQGNESYREGVRIILAERQVVLPVCRPQEGIWPRLWEFISPRRDYGFNGLVTKGLNAPEVET